MVVVGDGGAVFAVEGSGLNMINVVFNMTNEHRFDITKMVAELLILSLIQITSSLAVQGSTN